VFCQLRTSLRVAHRARDAVALLVHATPNFISQDMWSLNSPNLNPVDCRVWGVMQERIYSTPILDVADLNRRLIAAWFGLQQHVINEAIDQWRRRLRACVTADGFDLII